MNVSDPISGGVQFPIDYVCEQYYNQPQNGCVSRAGKTCNASALQYENDDYAVGSALLDPGCQEPLFKGIYEKYMQDMVDSNLAVYGFDGSKQAGRYHGWSHMYFMQTDKSRGATGQYLKYEYDTVENNQENLLAVSEYYEQGADILLQHKGFCGIRGRLGNDDQQCEIPCRYSFENRGFEVDFVMASSKDAAIAAGKRVEKQRRIDNAVNAVSYTHLTLPTILLV